MAIQMCKIDPWTWLDLWVALWEPEFEPERWIEEQLMRELDDILEIDPYPSDLEDDTDSEWEEERFYPIVCPEDLNPHSGENWEVQIDGSLGKT